MSDGPEHRKLAPWLIIGSMVVGMTLTTTIVLVGHCNRDKPYMDSVKIRKKKRPPSPAAAKTTEAPTRRASQPTP